MAEKTTVGAQLSEILNEEPESRESGFSRRRVVKGVAWSVPVIMTTVAVPPASASPGPTTPPPTPEPAGTFSTAPQSMPTTRQGNHGRTNEVLPARLSLTNLGGLTGEVTVDLKIAPEPASATAPRISFSKVEVGGMQFPFAPPTSGNVFTAKFKSLVPAGATTLIFVLSDYGYTGMKSDSGTYAFTTVISYVKGGVSVQMKLAPTYEFVLARL
ncbi:hypothetical protein HWD94_10685 [Pseudarthrobacter equi]|uniref:hypothetical protein n=1 Tax=Pseudarthrobacter equi TaxID=728066 RepID=UPI0021C2269C|nr:hypothetical protein [Pseudarthrobacter equi]MCT9625590.1 hypothetical protein [Pseudarthrobacter equi]